ncbi:MAG: hypothetical protein HYS22_00950 [Deltaproteobacteria bacterium]|nr:hypothetical protein [Deltaproteobacteria bacterium]
MIPVGLQEFMQSVIAQTGTTDEPVLAPPPPEGAPPKGASHNGVSPKGSFSPFSPSPLFLGLFPDAFTKPKGNDDLILLMIRFLVSFLKENPDLLENAELIDVEIPLKPGHHDIPEELFSIHVPPFSDEGGSPSGGPSKPTHMHLSGSVANDHLQRLESVYHDPLGACLGCLCLPLVKGIELVPDPSGQTGRLIIRISLWFDRDLTEKFLGEPLPLKLDELAPWVLARMDRVEENPLKKWLSLIEWGEMKLRITFTTRDKPIRFGALTIQPAPDQKFLFERSGEAFTLKSANGQKIHASSVRIEGTGVLPTLAAEEISFSSLSLTLPFTHPPSRIPQEGLLFRFEELTAKDLQIGKSGGRLFMKIREAQAPELQVSLNEEGMVGQAPSVAVGNLAYRDRDENFETELKGRFSNAFFHFGPSGFRLQAESLSANSISLKKKPEGQEPTRFTFRPPEGSPPIVFNNPIVLSDTDTSVLSVREIRGSRVLVKGSDFHMEASEASLGPVVVDLSSELPRIEAASLNIGKGVLYFDKRPTQRALSLEETSFTHVVLNPLPEGGFELKGEGRTKVWFSILFLQQLFQFPVAIDNRMVDAEYAGRFESLVFNNHGLRFSGDIRVKAQNITTVKRPNDDIIEMTSRLGIDHFTELDMPHGTLSRAQWNGIHLSGTRFGLSMPGRLKTEIGANSTLNVSIDHCSFSLKGDSPNDKKGEEPYLDCSNLRMAAQTGSTDNELFIGRRRSPVGVLVAPEVTQNFRLFFNRVRLVEDRDGYKRLIIEEGTEGNSPQSFWRWFLGEGDLQIYPFNFFDGRE